MYLDYLPPPLSEKPRRQNTMELAPPGGFVHLPLLLLASAPSLNTSLPRIPATAAARAPDTSPSVHRGPSEKIS